MWLPPCGRPSPRSDPTAVFLPMGLANPDHVLTHDAGLMVREALAEDDGGGPAWFRYEDAGYKHLPGLLAWRVSKLFRRRALAHPVDRPGAVGHGRASGPPS